MKIGKNVGNKVNTTLSKAKRNAWRLIVIAAILLGIILIGRPTFSLIKTSFEIRRLNKEKAIYQSSIRRDSLLMENLKNDEYLERYARERYFMQGKDEQVFIVE